MIRRPSKSTVTIRFRDIGMGDETYLDILGTVGLQLGLDRTAWATGVAPEEGVLLAKSKV